MTKIRRVYFSESIPIIIGERSCTCGVELLYIGGLDTQRNGAHLTKYAENKELRIERFSSPFSNRYTKDGRQPSLVVCLEGWISSVLQCLYKKPVLSVAEGCAVSKGGRVKREVIPTIVFQLQKENMFRNH